MSKLTDDEVRSARAIMQANPVLAELYPPRDQYIDVKRLHPILWYVSTLQELFDKLQYIVNNKHGTPEYDSAKRAAIVLFFWRLDEPVIAKIKGLLDSWEGVAEHEKVLPVSGDMGPTLNDCLGYYGTARFSANEAFLYRIMARVQGLAAAGGAERGLYDDVVTSHSRDASEFKIPIPKVPRSGTPKGRED